MNSVTMEISKAALDAFKPFIILVNRISTNFQCVLKGESVEMESKNFHNNVIMQITKVA